jgi:GNAT superfamily N-acetyltransferase
VSEPAPGGRVAPSCAPAWSVRAAVSADTSAVAGAVHQLLRELGGTPPPLIEMEKTVRGLIGDPAAGLVLVAEEDGAPGVEARDVSVGERRVSGAGEHGAPGVEARGVSVGERGVSGAGEHGAIVGVLAASWQTAIHVPGRYALIQDLWVAASHRGQAIGGALLDALFALARERAMARVEVGLPRESFAGIRATEAFYLHNGFAPLGARMRRLLS